MTNATGPTCKLIRPTDTYHGKQGLDYFTGISAERVGATGLCMHLLTIPPGGKAKAHRHEAHETAIYMLSGEAEVWYGENLKERLTLRAGEFLYSPARVPHLPVNTCRTEACSAVLARTDPLEQESVVLMPELDSRPEE